MKKNKKTIWAIVIVAAVIIIALVINRTAHRKIVTPTTEAEVPLVTTPAVTPSRTKAITKEVLPNIEHNYDKALAEYRTKRVQFSQNCTATPTKSSFAVGEKIMIDNRSDEMRGFRIGTQSVVVQAYDFSIVTLFEKGTFGVDCGTQINATTITVQ